jgi:hypothetical protein
MLSHNRDHPFSNYRNGRLQENMNLFSKKIYLVIAGIMLGLLGAEVSLGLFSDYHFDAMVAGKITEKDEYKLECYRHSGTFGYELVPHSSDDINSHGMRDREYTLKKPENTFRILLMGDSITEWGSWSSIVEKKFSRNTSFEILNSAVSGWGIRNYYRYLKHKGMEFEPDLVLLGLCLNDITKVMYTISFDRKNSNVLLFNIYNREGRIDYDLSMKINPLLFRNSYLYRFVTVNYSRKYKSDSAGDKAFLIGIAHEMKKITDGRILAVIFPYLKPLHEYTEDENKEYRLTTEVLDESGIDYLDLTGHFNKFGDNIADFRLKPADKIHFDEKSNKIKAQIIYKWLLGKIPEKT